MASKNLSANLNIGAKMASSVGRVFSGLNSKIKSQETTLKSLRTAYRDASKGTGEYAGKLDQLKGKIQTAEKELKRLHQTAKFDVGGALKKTGASIGSGMKKITLAAGAGLAASAVGALNITKDFIDYGDDIGDTAEALGMSTEALQSWQFAASEVGVFSEQMSASIAKFNKTVADGGADKTLEKLGINARRFKELSLDDQLEVTAEAFKDYKGTGNQAAMMMSLFGRSGSKLTGVFMKGRKGLMDFREAGIKSGAIMTKEMKDKADAAAKSLAQLSISYRGLKNRMGARFAPAAGAVFDMLSKQIEEKGPAMEKWAKDFSESFERDTVPQLKNVLDGTWFSDVGDAIKILWEDAKRSAYEWGSSIGIVISSALSSAWSNITAWLDEVGSYLGNLIVRNVEAVLVTVGEVIDKIKISFTAFFNWFDSKVTEIGSKMKNLWDRVKSIPRGVGDFFGVGAGKETSFNSQPVSPFSQMRPAPVPDAASLPAPDRLLSHNNTINNTVAIHLSGTGKNGAQLAEELRREIRRKPLFDSDSALLPG